MTQANDFLIRSYMEVPFFGETVFITTTQITTVIIMAFILLLAFLGRQAVLRGDPDRPGVIGNAVELLIESLDKMVLSGMGERGIKYRNYILTILVFLAVSNLSGLFGLRPPTADFAVTLGLGIITFILIQYVNFSHNGIGAVTNLFRPVPILFPINLIGEIANPISLSLRLFGNVVAGTIMMGLYYELLPGFAKIGIPAVLHAYLDVFSGLIQTYVFAMLTMVWISEKYS